mmetsp:Transcript_32382/g.95416  ORF Transcript_32382/g.95416 Transcript_32382/m.95416 type:complete len:257 (-) Transcript_32382:204-974(-)
MPRRRRSGKVAGKRHLGHPFGNITTMVILFTILVTTRRHRCCTIVIVKGVQIIQIAMGQAKLGEVGHDRPDPRHGAEAPNTGGVEVQGLDLVECFSLLPLHHLHAHHLGLGSGGIVTGGIGREAITIAITIATIIATAIPDPIPGQPYLGQLREAPEDVEDVLPRAQQVARQVHLGQVAESGHGRRFLLCLLLLLCLTLHALLQPTIRIWRRRNWRRRWSRANPHGSQTHPPQHVGLLPPPNVQFAMEFNRLGPAG